MKIVKWVIGEGGDPRKYHSVVHISEMVHTALFPLDPALRKNLKLLFFSQVLGFSLPCRRYPRCEGTKFLFLFIFCGWGWECLWNLWLFWVIRRWRSILKGSEKAKQASMFVHCISSRWQSSADTYPLEGQLLWLFCSRCRHRSHGWGWVGTDWPTTPSMPFTWHKLAGSQGSSALLPASLQACSSHCMAHHLHRHPDSAYSLPPPPTLTTLI